ncbi:putative MBL fold metallo-hydrolase [Paratrimastix pyriformis]|uniref:MBL fold metallo-hydrolase n=1 Tax=Paratrimastix pyriformis TaxID=342808 RepID=A0ABQ8UWY1_9EUKA|nr:putative MBL fold metallo-hydrolase [Paratrimastix pyriformis]
MGILSHSRKIHTETLFLGLLLVFDLLGISVIVFHPAVVGTFKPDFNSQAPMAELKKIIFPVGPIQANCCIIYDSLAKSGIIIDTGGDVEKIYAAVKKEGLTITGIYYTHAHIDHIDVTGMLQAKLRGVPIRCHQQDKFIYDMAQMQINLLGIPVPTPINIPPIASYFNEGDVIPVGSFNARVIHTPGHSPGSVCFHFPDQKLLIAGDTLFRGSYGRTDLWGGSEETLRQSITQKLFTLPPETRVVPGHGPETTIAFERANNPISD